MNATIIRIEADLFDKTADVRFSYLTGQSSCTLGIDKAILAEFDLIVDLETAKGYNVGEEVDVTITSKGSLQKRY